MISLKRYDISCPAAWKAITHAVYPLQVLEEACSHNANFIVTYHPTPFRPMKKFDYRSPTSRIIMECMKREIAVYSPHTALDCVPGGVNDWLISTIAGGIEGAEVSNVAPVNPSATLEGAGEGRIAEVSKGNLAQWIEATKARLGLPGVRVAIAMNAVKGEALSQKTVAEGAENVPIRTVAVCAGSGGSVLRRVKADLIITGELSHHECLAFAHEGCSVILTDHSNTERGYLPVLRSKLIAKYEEGVKASDGAAVEAFPDGIEVAVTQLDADPLVIM